MSSPNNVLDAVNSSGTFYKYATLAALETAFTAGNELYGKTTRMIVSMSDVVLNVTRVDDNTAIAWPIAANVPEPIQIKGFTASGSTATNISASAPIKVYL
jgi:hypothetical protein